MDQAAKSSSKAYFCGCCNISLAEDQLQDHLSLPLNHTLSKTKEKVSHSFKFKNSISNRIQVILKTQSQIQSTSNQLIQTIIRNTSIAVENLARLIRVYKDLLLEPQENIELQKMEIVCTFKTENSLSNALKSHFQQKAVAEKNTLDTVAQRLKSQVNQFLNNYVGAICCMEVLNDEKLVITGGFDGAIRLWNLQTKSQVWCLLKHKSDVFSIALGFKDEKLLSGSADMTVRLWDSNSKEQLHVFKGHTNFVTSVLFTSDMKKALSGSIDGSIKIWSIERKTVERTINAMSPIFQICLINGESTVVAAQSNGLVSFLPIKFVKSQKESLRKAQSFHNSHIKCICFAKNEKIFITGSDNGTVEIWATAELKKIHEHKEHSDNITKIEVSPCGNYFATAFHDYKVIIWNFKTKSITKKLKLQGTVNSLHYLKKSNFLLILCYDTFQLYNLGTSETNLVLQFKPLRTISISMDLRYMAFGIYELSLFDLEINKQISESSKLEKSISCIVFSKSCDSVVTGFSDGEIIIFRNPDLIKVRKMHLSMNYLKLIDISASKQYVAVSDATVMKIQSIETNKVIYKFQDNEVLCLRFCKTGGKFIYSDGKGIIILNKSFIQIASITLRFLADQMIESENCKSIIVIYEKVRWSIISLETFKYFYKDIGPKVVKDWCVKQRDFKCRAWLSLRQFVNLF